jgi:phospholipid transport system substrate-binding protein
MPKPFAFPNGPLVRLFCAFAIAFCFSAAEIHAEEGVQAVAGEENQTGAEGAGTALEAQGRVDAFHEALLEIMKEASALKFEGRAKRLQELLPGFVDQDYMAQKTLGRKWRKLTPEQQAKFLEAFRVLNVYSYADRFNGYTGEQFETRSGEIDPQGTARVESFVIVPDGEPVLLVYKLHKPEEGWLIKDVYLNGSVSEMALRRSEYSSIFKAEGFDALVAMLWAKSDTMMKADMTNENAAPSTSVGGDE